MSIRWRLNPDGQTKTAYLDITIAGYQRLRESTGIKSDQKGAKRLAQEYHDAKRVELWRQAKLGERPRQIWQEAVIKWVQEHDHKKSLETDISRLNWLDPHLRNQFLDCIDREFVESVLQHKMNDGVSSATTNRYAALIRSILRTACNEWNWMETAPHIRMRQESDDKVVWMTRAETDILLQELEIASRHLYEAVVFSLATGLRESNVAQLKWEQINMQKAAMYVYKTKNGRALGSPLNSDAMDVLKRDLGQHPTHVFTYSGKPVTRFNNNSYAKALARTMERICSDNESIPERLTDFNWHSLRHTWATWMAQSNCPMEQLQKLGGWKNMTMVLRVARHLLLHRAPRSFNVKQG